MQLIIRAHCKGQHVLTDFFFPPTRFYIKSERRLVQHHSVARSSKTSITVPFQKQFKNDQNRCKLNFETNFPILLFLHSFDLMYFLL